MQSKSCYNRCIMKDYLRNLLPNQHPLRLFYHRILAVSAAFIFGFPASKMRIVAVTGTNGKTTTCNILHKIFSEAGKKTGLITTVNFKIGEVEKTNLSKQTTLGPFAMQKLLRNMVKAGCELAIVEVTSHAIIQSRIWGINVDTAVFTNLTHDHLDYHGTMDEYMEAKGRLFGNLNISSRKANVPKISVINADDSEHEYFERFPVDQMFLFGIRKGIYRAGNLRLRPDGTVFDLIVPNGNETVDFKIPGRVNVYNALAAATVAVAHQINLQTIKSALEKMRPVAGRLETIDEGQDFTVVVDYAHATDSLEQLLSMFKELTSGKLILVFGATGDRDKTKRPIMGAVADKFADFIVLTDDDVYTEDRYKIAEMVKSGIDRREGDRFWQVLDRREAIKLGLSVAQSGDTLIVAGKGAEEFQVVGRRKVPHDDRAVVRELLSRSVDIEVPMV